MPWRELPHTADLRLEIQAADWAGLLAEAALALAAQWQAPRGDADRFDRLLRVSAFDREELLVRWLTELLFWHEKEGVVPVAVRVKSAGETSAVGEFTLVGTTEIDDHIKAVTYHELAVEPLADGLAVRIVFDT